MGGDDEQSKEILQKLMITFISKWQNESIKKIYTMHLCYSIYLINAIYCIKFPLKSTSKILLSNYQPII